MTCRARYTQADMIAALIQNKGLQAYAADQLHCSRRTVYRYIKRYPAVQEAYEDALQASLDVAQKKLMDLVEHGDWRAIRFVLSTLGKDRGFTTRQEIVAAGDDAQARYQQYLADVRKVYGDEEKDEEEDDE